MGRSRAAALLRPCLPQPERVLNACRSSDRLPGDLLRCADAEAYGTKLDVDDTPLRGQDVAGADFGTTVRHGWRTTGATTGPATAAGQWGGV